MPPDRNSMTYDVAFSFASEQQVYVEATARELQQSNVRVFYHPDQQVDNWGKDLYQELVDVYCNQARFCVVFISKAYRDKLWTRHELKAIQARTFQDSREYLLPARFDNIEIPGLLPTIVYYDLNELTPKQLAQIIFKKINTQSHHISCDEIRTCINKEIETQLAEAIFDAEDYLLPQPLRKSNAVADKIRGIFKKLDMQPTRKHLAPYLVDNRAAFRVVGYIAWQIYHPSDAIYDLISSVNSEQIEAIKTNETRPLWQLLVCFSLFMQDHPQSDTTEIVRARLRQLKTFLLSNDNIDPGEQCLNKIQQLITNPSK
jgi:hypothetical protein